MRSIYQPTRVVNCIDRIRDEKPARPVEGTASKLPGERDDSVRKANYRKERLRKYQAICDLIRTSTGPVTTEMAAEAVDVKPHRIWEFIREDKACPFELSKVRETDGNGYLPRRLVIKVSE